MDDAGRIDDSANLREIARSAVFFRRLAVVVLATLAVAGMTASTIMYVKHQHEALIYVKQQREAHRMKIDCAVAVSPDPDECDR